MHSVQGVRPDAPTRPAVLPCPPVPSRLHATKPHERGPRLMTLALAAALAATLTACGSSDPLAIVCSDFAGKDAATQLDLAARWGAPNRDHVGATERILAPTYRADLLRYCPNHPNVKLTDVALRLTGG